MHRLFKSTHQIKWRMLQPQSSRKLPRPRVRRLARLVRQRNHLRQTRMRRPPRPRLATLIGPIRRVRRAIVPQLLKRLVRRVTGQVVVITRVMIPSRAAGISNAMHQRKVMSLLRQQRQVLADANVRRRGGNWLKLPAIFNRRLRLHVPHVDVRRSAAEKKEQGRFCRLPRRQRRARAKRQAAKAESGHADGGCRQESATAEYWREERWSHEMLLMWYTGRGKVLHSCGQFS